jgi:hypothetical protein
MMAISAHAMQMLVNPPPELRRLVLEKDRWFTTLPIKSGVELFIALNSTTPARVAEAIGSGTLTSQAINWRKAFLRAPLLEVGPSAYCYTCLPALHEALGRAFFSRLLDHYNATYSRNIGDAFLDYYGRFMEDYVYKLLSRAIRKTVVGDDEAFATKDSTDNRIVDAVIVEIPDITFVEVTAKRFNLTKTIIGGNIEALDKDLQQMIVEKAQQLQVSIDFFSDSKLPMVPVKPDEIKRVHAVLVLQEFPQYAAVRRRALQLAKEAGVDLPLLQFVTVDELEMVEMSLRKGYKFADIMRRKCRRKDEVEMSLTNYIVKRQLRLARGKPPDLEAAQKVWFDERIAQLEEWGFNSVTPRDLHDL